MDVILQAADSLAVSNAIEGIQRRLDELFSKMDMIISLVKKKKEKTPLTKTRFFVKTASREILKLSGIEKSIKTRIQKRIDKSSLKGSSSSIASSSSAKRLSDYYDKYPEIKKKFWGVGPGRRSSSTLQKMDRLIAQLK